MSKSVLTFTLDQAHPTFMLPEFVSNYAITTTQPTLNTLVLQGMAPDLSDYTIKFNLGRMAPESAPNHIYVDLPLLPRITVASIGRDVGRFVLAKNIESLTMSVSFDTPATVETFIVPKWATLGVNGGIAAQYDIDNRGIAYCQAIGPVSKHPDQTLYYVRKEALAVETAEPALLTPVCKTEMLNDTYIDDSRQRLDVARIIKRCAEYPEISKSQLEALLYRLYYLDYSVLDVEPLGGGLRLITDFPLPVPMDIMVGSVNPGMIDVGYSYGNDNAVWVQVDLDAVSTLMDQIELRD